VLALPLAANEANRMAFCKKRSCQPVLRGGGATTGESRNEIGCVNSSQCVPAASRKLAQCASTRDVSGFPEDKIQWERLGRQCLAVAIKSTEPGLAVGGRVEPWRVWARGESERVRERESEIVRESESVRERVCVCVCVEVEE
jgi:hypothetical protein